MSHMLMIGITSTFVSYFDGGRISGTMNEYNAYIRITGEYNVYIKIRIISG